MRRLEYNALRKITGGYHGSSHEALGYIANAEPLQDKLNDISRSWAARAVRTGNSQIRVFIKDDTSWHYNSSNPHDYRTAISEAFYQTAADPEELSFGDRDNTATCPIIHEEIFVPQSEKSKYLGCWAAEIGSILEEGSLGSEVTSASRAMRRHTASPTSSPIWECWGVTQQQLANVQPLESKLHDLVGCWAARATRINNTDILALTDTYSTNPISSAFKVATSSALSLLSRVKESPLPPTTLTQTTLFEPADPLSKDKSQMDTQARGFAAAFFSEDSRGNPSTTGHSYLGAESTVADADAERQAIVLALRANRDMPMIALRSDSSSAISSTVSISQGLQAPRSIECELSALLMERETAFYGTTISWVRAHIGIPGNEQADQLAAFSSALGQVSSAYALITEGGIRQASKAIRSQARTATGTGVRRTTWNRHALSAYTWLRTD
ncbi:hypothetical protein BGX38DRAFT_1275823 [Terfezia claveryi]|nr:hypothetical protein BGX38DRAFT_1275823 [Terfezia claveryi]